MAFDMEKLKELTRRLGGILVMNGSEPEMVILPYEKFIELERPPSIVAEPASMSSPRDEELIDALNKEILALKEEIRQKETAELVQEETII